MTVVVVTEPPGVVITTVAAPFVAPAGIMNVMPVALVTAYPTEAPLTVMLVSPPRFVPDRFTSRPDFTLCAADVTVGADAVAL